MNMMKNNEPPPRATRKLIYISFNCKNWQKEQNKWNLNKKHYKGKVEYTRIEVGKR